MFRRRWKCNGPARKPWSKTIESTSDMISSGLSILYYLYLFLYIDMYLFAIDDDDDDDDYYDDDDGGDFDVDVFHRFRVFTV